MISNDYVNELSRLQHIGPVEVPHLRDVKMIIKDRLDAHTYDPYTLKDLEKLGDDPVLSGDLSVLRSGTDPVGVPEMTYPGIHVDSKITHQLGRHVRFLRIYKDGYEKADKALIYIHGGAYYGGSAEDSLIPLRLLATKFEGVIYSIDYGLCPEHPYPYGLLDCLAVISRVAKERHHITLAGDSAGASMALGVSQMAYHMGICNVEQQLLFYPTVVHGSDLDGPMWDDKRISIIPDQRHVLHSSYLLFKQLDRTMTKFYIEDENIDITSPIISPLYADPTLFKKVVILTGEYDPFRLQDEAFAEEVGTAGGDVTFIRYGGMGHAFLNLVGRAAASEDAIYECAKYL
ncbi:alpha/beta hydrolase fold domain-containing protein [Companilactobacillus mishanensis]|uniref:Alpha/beta hydrolase n=1 Tax=Companilactobacillus mishanensis TaxID=2486008 RepID=A0A5P0ZGD3_9LACO|nr:alpha/beta hydrolase fold domain-containing protein [Companilactobacillus mishanensis]MQS52069.1 alpha/beta hydrolase [Companilactobacillus mishanensis]